MRKTKLFCIALAFVMALSTLFGCAGSGEKASTEHEPITIMNALRDYSGLVELVKEKYPEINLEIVPYRGRNQSAYMKQQIETGSMPDIYTTTQAWDDEYQKENLLDLSNYAVASLYNTARLDKYNVDSGVYLLPFDYTVSGICYNASLFEREGIAVPTSFTELETETVPALKAKGINVAVTLLDLPGSAFNFFFNASSSVYMNTNDGKQWRADFTDADSDTYASGDENIKRCTDYFQRWIDCGVINYEDGVSTSQTALEKKFDEGNTAFMVGSIKKFASADGDQYKLMPYLSDDGQSNTYIVTPGRLYGLSKTLGEKSNEQKLQDALHVFEVLSTNEGYEAVVGTTSNNLCSIKDFNITESTQYYANAIDALSKGFSMDLVYVGWDGYLKPFGNAILDWIKGTEGCGPITALKVLDDTKRSIKAQGITYYADVTEELDTVQAARLTGQIFMDATGADGALVSYNVYNPEINANLENSYGTNGRILVGKQTEEYITIWLATGWSEKIYTITKTGKEIKERAKAGADTRKTGYHYPYVTLSKDGKMFEDDKEYTIVIVGHNRSERETMGLYDTGIVGLDAAKTYLKKIEVISSASLDDSMVLDMSGYVVAE